ncbi:MAG: HlyD family efflux transporter periplasmic adaptor subunit [Planctomycetota bacterium]
MSTTIESKPSPGGRLGSEPRRNGTVEKRYNARPLSQAAYREEDFPALQLARVTRVVRRVGKVMLWLLLFTAVALVFVPWQQTVSGQGSVIALDPLERPQPVQAPIKGIIAERYPGIQENAFVKQGQPLFRIENQDPDFIARLNLQVEAVKMQVKLAESQRQQAVVARDFATEIIQLTKDEITSLELAQQAAWTENARLIDQANAKLAAARSKLLAAKAKRFQAEQDYNRKKKLYEEGIETQVKFQEAEQKFRVAMQDIDIAQQDITDATAAVASKESAQASKQADWQSKINKVQSQLRKANGDIAKAEQAIAKADADIRDKEIKLQKELKALAEQEAGKVTAPRDGFILDLAVNNAASVVKEGQQLCRIVPRTTKLAVEVLVAGNDAPLIVTEPGDTPGPHARLQFQGWPAAQFAGWPNVAVGTFGGTVTKKDSFATPSGLFRVVIEPDDSDQTWPDEQYLRQGVRCKAWVLLDQVPLWWEVWRRINGFPPSLQMKGESSSTSKVPKLPKP